MKEAKSDAGGFVVLLNVFAQRVATTAFGLGQNGGGRQLVLDHCRQYAADSSHCTHSGCTRKQAAA
jgi:hypothetical protein